MHNLVEFSTTLKSVVKSYGRVKSLDAAESLSAFMVLGSIKALCEATISDIALYIFDSVSIELSSQNVTNITKRLENDHLIECVSGNGRKGDPKIFSLTVDGDTELKNAISVFMVLLDFGIDAILKSELDPRNDCKTSDLTADKVSTLNQLRASRSKQTNKTRRSGALRSAERANM